jgi:chemotaxis protein MotB
MLEDHHAGPKHDSLLQVRSEDDSDSAWLVSYIDIMTLLVALFVIIIVAAEAANPGWLTHEAMSEAPPVLVEDASATLGVPLPDAFAEQAGPVYVAGATEPGELAAWAISAALGVAGLPDRAPVPPPLLARAKASVQEPDAELPAMALPKLLLADSADLTAPLADYMVVLTDRPPVNVQTVEPEALQGGPTLAETLPERQESAPYLPDLDGVEASRVSEGINLRVQNQLLFESAEAGLSDAGEALVASLVETIERYDGDVSVEGHSDSRSIDTEEYPSNWALSSARAIAIVQVLEDAGVTTGRLRAVGLAATRPLADNDTLEGRARNRRVEVVIHVE